MERPYANYAWKTFLMLMTSLMTSQSDDKLGLLYSCLNEIGTFFAITLKRFKVWSSNLMFRCAIAVWPCLQKILLVASLMTSPCWKWVEIFNRRNFVNIWARKPIISAEHTACPWLSWLYLQIPVPLPGKKFTPQKMAAIFKIPQFSWQPQSDHISGNYSMRRKKWCVIH